LCFNTRVRSNKRQSKGSQIIVASNKTFGREALLCLGLGLLILVFYSNSFHAGLLFDSEIIIKGDPRLRGLNWTNLQQIISRNYWWPMESNVYRPLTTVSYLINYSILGNGENPPGYHVLNLLLHWFNSWLVLLITRRLSNRLDIALLAASLFAVHPVNTEAVTNVVGRADLLATLFVLLAGWSYIRAGDPDAREGIWLALMAVAATIGTMAKENGIMIVAFVPLYDRLWHRRPFSELCRRYVALVPAAVLVVVIRRWVEFSTVIVQEFFIDNPLAAATPFQRMMTAIGIIGRYLRLLVFPRTLSADYSFNQIPIYGTNTATDIAAYISLAVIAALIGAAIYLRSRQKLFAWGVLFFFLMMLPTSNLILTIGSIMADRFMYLPSIGFCAAAAVILLAISEKVAPLTRVRWGLPVALIGLLGIRTYVRNVDWNDNVSLWQSTVAAAPASFKAHMIYGQMLLANADQDHSRPVETAIDNSITQEEIARSIVEREPPLPLKWLDPTVYLNLAKAYRMKGQILETNGNHDDAVSLYRKSLEVLGRAQEIDRFQNQKSREVKLRRGVAPQDTPDTGNYFVYESLCLTYLKLGQWQECEAAGRYLEHVAPQQSTGYRLVGTACFNRGHYADAAVQFLAGLLLEPENTDWWANLTTTYNNLGVQPNPVTNLGSSYSLNKDSPLIKQQLYQAAAMLVRLYEEARKVDDAREMRQRLVQQYSVPPEVFSRGS